MLDFHRTDISRHAPRASHPAAAAPHPAPHPASTHGVWYTIRGCVNQPRRSRVDLNLTPTVSPLMRSLMAHVCWRMAVAAWMSYVSPHIHRPPRPCRALIQWLALTLTPHLCGTQACSRLCYNHGRWARRAPGSRKGAACTPPPCLTALGPHTTRGLASSEECSSWNYRQNTIAERPSWHQSEEAPTPTPPRTAMPAHPMTSQFNNGNLRLTARVRTPVVPRVASASPCTRARTAAPPAPAPPTPDLDGSTERDKLRALPLRGPLGRPPHGSRWRTAHTLTS